MAVAHFNYFNDVLAKEVGFIALLPDRQDQSGPFPAFYLLHGLSDDYTAWLRWTSIELYVRDIKLLVILPDGDRSWYSDSPRKGPYETSIIDGLIPFAERYLPVIPKRSARVIGGLSMGGYGAMKLALKYPHLFCSVATHSGAYEAARSEDIDVPGIDCCFQLAEDIDKARLPHIRFDCGTDDFLLDQNRRFHDHLEALDIPHQYHEFPGGHNWRYWDEHVRQAIDFHCAALGIEKPTDAQASNTTTSP